MLFADMFSPNTGHIFGAIGAAKAAPIFGANAGQVFVANAAPIFPADDARFSGVNAVHKFPTCFPSAVEGDSDVKHGESACSTKAAIKGA